MESYDVIILGAGPGGTPAAMFLAQKRKKVLLIDERGRPGGECLFEGCIPSKMVEQSSEDYSLVKNLLASGIDLKEETPFQWQKVLQKKDTVINARADGALRNMEHMPTLTFVNGKGRFTSGRQLEVLHKTGKKESVAFDKAIIATGSKAFVPPIEGNGVNRLWTNKELLEAETLPASLVIIGAGPIGIEFAQMLSKLGITCTIIEMMDRILPPVDSEFSALLLDKMERENGIHVHLSSRVRQISVKGDMFETAFEDRQGKGQTILSERVLVAAGRVPNIEDLHLESTSIAPDRKGIIVNEYLETTEQGIYAVGDVIQGPKFAHTATYEALIAARNIVDGNRFKLDLSKNAWVLFSDPEIASAGLTEKEALKQGLDIVTGTYDFKIDARAQISEKPFGFLKFVVKRETAQIIGVHLFTKGASNMAGEASLIISMKATLRDVADAIHPHPTLTESFGFLAKNMLAQVAK